MAAYSFIAIIYNPNSTGPSKANAEKLARSLRRRMPSQNIDCMATEHAGHGEELAYDIAKKYKRPLIVSSSGDGGYNEVINGVMRARNQGFQATCAVLPSGNANDHRRTLKSQSLLKGILDKKITRIDLLCVAIHAGSKDEQRYAHSYIGFGLTPTIAAELNRHTLNSLKEAWIVLKTFYKLQPFELIINNTRTRLDSLIFSNIHRMAKVLKLSDKSRVHDGKFEVTFFPHGRKLALVGKLARAAFSHSLPNERTDHYEFTTVKKMPMQLDGEVREISAGAKVRITCHKQALQTIL